MRNNYMIDEVFPQFFVEILISSFKYQFFQTDPEPFSEFRRKKALNYDEVKF